MKVRVLAVGDVFGVSGIQFLRERLKGNIAAQENSVKRSNAEREQAAQEADQLLRDVINPYMEKITLFENEVRRFYAE